MNYEWMSDFEINVEVANALSVCFETHEQCVYVSIKRDGRNVVSVAGIVDYCNNPSDAWPVIVKNKVTIFSPNDTHDDSLWMAELDEFHMFSENPLRAAMIVFLMMKDAEK